MDGPLGRRVAIAVVIVVAVVRSPSSALHRSRTSIRPWLSSPVAVFAGWLCLPMAVPSTCYGSETFPVGPVSHIFSNVC